jgi:hypothetical protein
VIDMDFPEPGGPHKRMDLDEETMVRIRCSCRSVSRVVIRASSFAILEASISVNGTQELQGFQEKSMGETKRSRSAALGNAIGQIRAHDAEKDCRSVSNIEEDSPHQQAMQSNLRTASSSSEVTEGRTLSAYTMVCHAVTKTNSNNTHNLRCR